MSNQFPPPPGALHQGLRMYVPGPVPVSGPALPAPPGAPVGKMGVQYGIQQARTWQPGDATPQQLIDTLRSESLWRFSVFGAVLVTVFYGTSKGRSIVQLQAPVVMTIPGQLIVTAEPVDVDAGAVAVVTLTEATGGERSQARKFVVRGGADVALDEGAIRYVALTASTLTISGAAVVVPALSTVPLVVGSVLTAGSGFQEFEA